MSYHENIENANVRGALTSAAATGTLWAIAISWSNAIRGITLAIFPVDQGDVILGEVVAALATTVLGVSVATLLARSCKTCNKCTEVSIQEESKPSSSTVRVVRGARGV